MATKFLQIVGNLGGDSGHTHSNKESVLDQLSIDNHGVTPHLAFNGISLVYAGECPANLRQSDIHNILNGHSISLLKYLGSDQLKYFYDRILEDINQVGYAKTEDIPTKVSQFENDSGFITADDVIEVKTEVLALQEDVISRVNELRITVPNSATMDGTTLKMQRTVGDVATDLFSVELPSGGTASAANDEDIMDAMAEMNLVEPITLLNGAILTSNNGEIYSL